MAQEEKRWKPTEEELKEILEQHKKWLKSFGKDGKQGNLHGTELLYANLQGANLRKANLQGAMLWRANLQEANLEGANLQGASLFDANLQGANLEGANLQGASLWKANLRNAILLSANLQGANLDGANLQKAILADANLQEAELRGAKFQAHPDEKSPTVLSTDNYDDGAAADQESRLWALLLTRTNFQGAYLTGANLHGAIFAYTRFEDADLSHANLTGGKRLSLQQLAGAKLNGAQLPEDIKKFDSLQQVDEASRSAKRIFLAMLLACAYSALTIFSTTDAQLLPNSASSPLPIIGTSIPIAGFFGVAPAILLAMFLYFQLYLQRLWEDLAMLPAVFPDGTPLDKRVFPWLLNGLVQRYVPRLSESVPVIKSIYRRLHLYRVVVLVVRYVPRLKPYVPAALRDAWWEQRPTGYRTAMYLLRVVVASLLAWWIVPLTIGLFWIRYLPRHDWLVTGFHIGFLVVAIVFAAWSQGLAKRTVRGHVTRPETSWPKWCGLAGLSVASLLLVLVLSDGALQWERLDGYAFVKIHRGIVPAFLPYILASANADVTEADVSTRLPSWYRVTGQERLDSVRGARLADLNLRYLLARYAFLVKADLRRADLREANLEGANLQEANLVGANLQEADFGFTNLQEADLVQANLQGAKLPYANLQEAKLWEANLQEADFQFANLQKANLETARSWDKMLGIGLANLHSVNAPEGFMTWAVDKKAVCMADEKQWRELVQKAIQKAYYEGISPEELRTAQKDCFPDTEQGEASK